MSKDEILKKLITTQLDHIAIEDGEDDDLNEISGAGASGPRADSNSHRFFINLGSVDGLTSADMVHLLSDISGVKRKHFGQIDLKKNCSFFDVQREHSDGFGDKFRGLEIDGRAIRVNRDDDAERQSSDRHRGKSQKRNYKRKKERSRRPGRR